MKKTSIVLLIAIAAFILVSCSKNSPTVVNPVSNTYVAQFQQGVLPSSAFNGFYDTYITNASGKTNNIFPACDTLKIGVNSGNTYRIAISCALNYIPSSATVTKAFLTLTGQTLDYTGITVTAYAQSVYWFQGSSGCDTGYTYSFDARWNGPWISAGGDLNKSMSNSPFISYISPNRQLTLELDTATVQNWIKYGVSTDPAADNGLIIKSSNEAVGYGEFISSDNSSYLPYRPILTVYYQL
jgi:hypothetical protein